MSRLRPSLPIILCLLLFTDPVQAQQNEDSPLQSIDFTVHAMQSAQLLRTESGGRNQQTSDEAEFGFHRIRFNLGVTAILHDRISVLADLGHEPNDFGADFAPQVDYVALDLQLTDAITFRTGTPVTGLFNFRGYSDGAVTQSNPLIGNSPIDFVTAETGVTLIGSYDTFGWDLTWTSPDFFETFAPGTGFTLVGKLRGQLTETLSLGIGVGIGTNDATISRRQTNGQAPRSALQEINLIVGDGENYSLPGFGPDGAGQPNRYTHAYLLPGAAPILFQVDARVDLLPAFVDVWGGWGTERFSFADASGTPMNARLGTALVEQRSHLIWLGSTAKIFLSPQVYLAARGTYADNQSGWAAGRSGTGLWRVQAGGGLSFFDRALLKVEVVHQREGAQSPGQIGEDWTGALVELSVDF